MDLQPVEAIPKLLAPPSPLIDGHGRTIDYLRISITERCNLRCVYCMPLETPSFPPRDCLLTAEEIETLCRAATALGFRKFRLTGGEPTLRHDVVDIVRRIAAIPGVEDLAMTTNGSRLQRLAAPLAEAGLRRVNIHIDARDFGAMTRLMRWSRPQDIWAGVEAAERAGLTPIKLNAVVARGYNHDAIVELAGLTLDRPWQVRFIELMPLGSGDEARFASDHFVPSAETAGRIEAAIGPLTPLPNRDPADESRNFRLPGAAGTVGFISPLSQPYCGRCNRLRLTADGKLHLCLLRDDELDLRGALRAGGGEVAAREILRRAVAAKPSGHALQEGIHARRRRMHAVGG